MKKYELVASINFLDRASLKGRASIGRTKLKQVLGEVMDQYTADQTAVIDEFDAWTDKENGQYEVKILELKEALDDLGQSEIKVSLDSPFLVDLKSALADYDQDLTGQGADGYASLYIFLEEELENE